MVPNRAKCHYVYTDESAIVRKDKLSHVLFSSIPQLLMAILRTKQLPLQTNPVHIIHIRNESSLTNFLKNIN